MSKETHGGHDSLPLNGVSLDEGMHKLMKGYLAHEAHGDTAVPTDHPVWKRQGRLTDEVEGIEKIVKDSLGGAVRLDPHNRADEQKANAIIKKLVYEFAKTRKYHGKMEDLTSEDIGRYLVEAGTSTGDPTIGNPVELKKSILNMVALKPGHPLYDKNSAIAHFMQYIASQKDDKSRELQHIQTVLQQHANDPRYITAARDIIGPATGTHYSPGATIPEIIRDLNQAGEAQAQEWARKVSKTYTAPPAPASGGAHATH